MAKSLGVFAGCGATLRAAELGRLDQPDEARSASSEVGCTPTKELSVVTCTEEQWWRWQVYRAMPETMCTVPAFPVPAFAV